MIDPDRESIRRLAKDLGLTLSPILRGGFAFAVRRLAGARHHAGFQGRWSLGSGGTGR